MQTLASLVHEQGRAGIMVTHDLGMVEFVDRVIQMMDGRVVRTVSPDEDLACLADPDSCEMNPSDRLGVGEAECGARP